MTEFELVPLSELNLDIVREWRNSVRIRKSMYTSHVISPDEHKAWFEKLKTDSTQAFFVFNYKEKPTGLVYFSDIQSDGSSCYWGFYRGDEKYGKGTGLRMGAMGLEWAFEKRQIKTVIGETMLSNEAGIRFHQNLGFEEKGAIKKEKNGNLFEVAVFTMSGAQWKQKKESLGVR